MLSPSLEEQTSILQCPRTYGVPLLPLDPHVLHRLEVAHDTPALPAHESRIDISWRQDYRHVLYWQSLCPQQWREPGSD